MRDVLAAVRCHEIDSSDRLGVLVPGFSLVCQEAIRHVELLL